MPRVSWQADAAGRYWVDVAIGNQMLSVMIDTGLVDSHGLVGFEINPSICQQVRQAGQFSRPRWRNSRDATGRVSRIESSRTASQLVDPVSRKPVGPTVPIYVSCGAKGVPSRVGIVFFHRLTGCRVIWQLDGREWIVEYP